MKDVLFGTLDKSLLSNSRNLTRTVEYLPVIFHTYFRETTEEGERTSDQAVPLITKTGGRKSRLKGNFRTPSDVI